ncbi:hypothetical protein [Bosea sp. ASV33]|uniref:hypothetical protein n=1 Tax=Bosea sp. ASV33 TaxID=2795106 RepID=UPI0018ECD4E3|nr:hypothetical protein [Bosea sp. ASV33]
MMMQGHANPAFIGSTAARLDRSVGHSTGVHSIRTRSPDWLAVWQTTLAGSNGDAAAGAGVVAATGITAAAGLATGSTGRVRDEASCGAGRAIGLGLTGCCATGGAGGSSTVSTAGGAFCATTGGGGCSGDARHGVQELSRVKASMVGRVIVSAVGIDCMQPESAKPNKQTAARFGIDSIFAAPAVD